MTRTYLERSIDVIEMDPVRSHVLGYLLVRSLQSLIVEGKADEELVCGVGQEVLDLLGLVDQHGAGLVDVLDEGDETVPVPGPGVLHHKLLVPVQPKKYKPLMDNSLKLYLLRSIQTTSH